MNTDPEMIELDFLVPRSFLEKTLQSKIRYSDELTEALRRALDVVAQKNLKAGKISQETLDSLAGWISNANRLSLSEWLEKGGWEKVDKVEVEKELNPFMGIYELSFVIGEDGGRVVKPLVETVVEGVLNGSRATFYLPENYKLGEATREDDWKVEDDWNGPPVNDPDGEPALWLRLLVARWMMEAAEVETHRLETYARALPFRIKEKGRTSFGDLWTPLPRALEGAAAMGGPIKIDEEIYAQNPSFAPRACAEMQPRNMDLVPEEWMKRSKQLSLGLDMADARAWLFPEHGLDEAKKKQYLEEWMVAIAAKTAVLAQLPNMCPKLLGLMFATAPMTGRPVKGTLLELAQWLHPDWKNRRQTKRDLQAVGDAFVALKGLRLIETKPNGVQHPYDLFTLDYDLSYEPDAQVGFRLNPFLVERMKGKGGGGLKESGYFLLNMTRWLAMGTQSPRLFPLALRLAAEWDRARMGGIYKPERLQWIEADRLAIETNTLPEGASLYLAGKTASRSAQLALNKARSNLEDDLDKLKDAGLLGDWEKRKIHGKGFSLLPVPPDGYDEACKGAVRAVREYRAAKENRKGKR